MIAAAALVNEFQYAYDNKWGYIWGTAGVKWTQARQDALEKTTDSNRAQGRKYGSKWIGHMVADCSGLFSWAFAKLGGYMYHGSNTMWDKYCTDKGDLKDGKRTDGKELLPGTAVFCYNASKKNRGHVGLYVGNGWVIEDASTTQGVIRSKITNSKWVEWGELKGVDYSGEPVKEPVKEEPVKTEKTIRKGNMGETVKKCQKMLEQLGYDLGICGVDGDFGQATEKAVKAFQKAHDGPDGRALTVDGVVGPNTWWALENAVNGLKPEEPEVYYCVTVPHLTTAQAEALLKQYANATMTAE